jgi:RNA polymerase sigma factor for flagellar operon FliA
MSSTNQLAARRVIRRERKRTDAASPRLARAWRRRVLPLVAMTGIAGRSLRAASSPRTHMISNSQVCPRTPASRRKSTVTRQSACTRPRRVRPGTVHEADLVDQYIPLVRNVVGRLAMTLPPHVDGEDLYSAGLQGLLNAIRNYNPSAGTSFETYARLRIRGAVFDELRRMDWVPRSVHAKARKMQRVMNDLEQSKGRMPTDNEMARGLKLSIKEYQEWLEETRPATFVCLDAAFNSECDDTVSQHESLADPRQENPLDGTFRHELSELIAQRLKQLPEIQRKVLALYYYEDLRLREIAEAFGLTESRICQIHAQAIQAIKTYLRRFDPCFA